MAMALHASFAMKRVIVTGAANGLGRDLAQRLHADQAKVIAVDKDTPRLQSLQKDCPEIGILTADLENWTETRKIVDTIGPVDILVNNAGFLKLTPVLLAAESDLDTILNVNFKSMVNISQSVARKMIATRTEGIIVNVSSYCSLWAVYDMGLYCCSKAAVNMLTKSLAVELGPFNIRVNAIAPAGLNTTFGSKEKPLSDAALELLSKRLILKRDIETKEAVDAILFLASPLSTMITGEILNIDGGTAAN